MSINRRRALGAAAAGVATVGIEARSLWTQQSVDYLQDWLMFHMKPHVYCALEPDSEQRAEYLKVEESECQ